MDVLSAIKIGDLVRENYGYTSIRNDNNYSQAKCFSACVLIYSAGIAKDIQIGNEGNWLPVGVHSHFLSEDTVKNLSIEDSINHLKNVTKEISNYFDRLGVSLELLTISLSIPKKSLVSRIPK